MKKYILPETVVIEINNRVFLLKSDEMEPGGEVDIMVVEDLFPE